MPLYVDDHLIFESQTCLAVSVCPLWGEIRVINILFTSFWPFVMVHGCLMYMYFVAYNVGVAYKVTVKTGAKKNGGTDAKVLYIILS